MSHFILYLFCMGACVRVSVEDYREMAEQETCATLSENVTSDCERKHEGGTDMSSTSEVTVSCATHVSSCSEMAITPSECLQASASSASSGETCNRDTHSLVDVTNNVIMSSSKCQFTDSCTNAQDRSQLASCSASGTETLTESVHRKAQESVDSELPLSCTTNCSTADACNSFSNHTFHSSTESQTTKSITDKTANSVEETKENSTDNHFPSTVTDAGRISVEQAKPTAIVSTPEAQSIRCSLVQSSLLSTRQVKCRKTGHRRITASGANLSLGRLINAVSESCLSDSLDSTYIHTSSLSGRSGAAEHRMTTPVKAANAPESGVIKEKLSRHFGSESTGSPVSCSTADAQGSPQVVDGVRRPPKARKSFHSNDNKVVSDLSKESASNPPGTSFGTVCLAELVDAQSLDKLDGRTFDEMLLAKMWDAIQMRPSNGFKLLLQSNESPQMHAATSSASQGVASTASDNEVQDLGSGTPLIPSTARMASLNCDSSARSAGSGTKSSTSTDGSPQYEKKAGCSSFAEVTSAQAESSRKRVWRCRKSSWSPQRSASSIMNGTMRHSGEKPRDHDATAEAQTTRKSPLSGRPSPSWQCLDEVRKCNCFTCVIVTDRPCSNCVIP